MHSTLLISALCGLAIAAPKPQIINVPVTDNLALPGILGPDDGTQSSYNPTKAAAAAAAAIQTNPVSVDKRDVLEKRDACSAQAAGAGPVPGQGSVADYLDQTNILSTTAQGAPTPSGYTSSFTNLQGSIQQIGYLIYENLPSYDVQACADLCSNVDFCLGFNIYHERNPSQDPAAACPDPAPTTNIKCSVYGYPVSAASATNTGQYLQAFQVVIAGSNGYSRDFPYPPPWSQTNFTGPNGPLNGAINAPLDNGVDTYLGNRVYNDNPYDPSLCAAVCQAQTSYDRATAASNGTYKPCNFYTAYVLLKNDVPQGTHCGFYTRAWDASYASNTGYYDGSDVYKVVASFTYTLTAPDSGHM
ncbi:hypothetical protein K504DRAFT_460360 [Pleomassaria siparia CBS 279.74]|uniref:Apple domain-containing protein n=1 Tax=Pleomassaria siparia CBS 279.74 TaxID=1314801 RepID=A0A6G1JZ69_9PLEO|nr:hypothetical protein K504DRAFT_460360 [Pleomassaria siparia CBS 279.74]